MAAALVAVPAPRRGRITHLRRAVGSSLCSAVIRRVARACLFHEDGKASVADRR